MTRQGNVVHRLHYNHSQQIINQTERLEARNELRKNNKWYERHRDATPEVNKHKKKDDKRNDVQALENIITKQVRNNSISFNVTVDNRNRGGEGE